MTHSYFDGGEAVPPQALNVGSQRAAMVMYEIGGHRYPMISSNKCNTCKSGYRIAIERSIIRGHSLRLVQSVVPEGIEAPSISSLRGHKAKHMPHNLMVLDALKDRRAQALGRDADDYVGTMVDYMGLGEAVIQKAYEQVADGMPVTLGEAASWGSILQRQQTENGGGIDKSIFNSAFRAMAEVVGRFMDPTRYADFYDALSAHPDVRRYMEAQAIETKAIESGGG